MYIRKSIKQILVGFATVTFLIKINITIILDGHHITPWMHQKEILRQQRLAYRVRHNKQKLVSRE